VTVASFNPGWLGRYDDGGDTWEGGSANIRLTRVDENTVRFTYSFESRSNHGYDLASQEGIVIGVDDTSITIRLMHKSAASWEDWYKEDHRLDEASSETTSITIKRIENGRPVLDYGRRELVWYRAD
jgi:hypothetical protein